jgi:hypothetical protein
MYFPELTYWRDATVPVSCFLLFCVSEKLHRKYSQNWMKQKPKFLFFLTRDGIQSTDRGEPGASHTIGWRGQPLARATRWWGHLAHLLMLPFRIYILLGEENLNTQTIFHETYCKPPSLSTRDREGPEALLGTLSERGITAGGLLHHHACLRSDVWVVFLGLRVIAVARWMSSPPCASCLDLVSCLSWSRSSLCNSTCCVCWDPMNIGTLSSWFIIYHLYVISMLFMILHALRY